MQTRLNTFHLSPEAARDITEIYEYLAERNLDAAERIRIEIHDAMQTIARSPYIGHARPDLTSLPVLFWPLRHFLIIYWAQSSPLQILAILHGKRNVAEILRQR